jgi:hypothetical protein
MHSRYIIADEFEITVLYHCLFPEIDSQHLLA